ncbi:DNA methyltransferase [Tritonibacter mobilis]|uniref:DNA methyltransferase n=1 Tax=Tritonibacter mobilis TaxID=379347 RepID=UPI0009BE0D52|nr:DNA methyltransferase [Tritonibacter mobilis]
MTTPILKLRAADKSGVAFERLPTNTTTRKHGIHRWYNFIAGFSPEFVEACISMTPTGPNASKTVLDPFSGCGTTPVTARLLGCNAIGYEPHPFFATISEAKANSQKYWDDLTPIKEAIFRGIVNNHIRAAVLSESASIFLNKLFQEDDLECLLRARSELERCGFGHHPLAILVLSRVADHVCLAATDGIYKAPTTKKRSKPPLEALDKVFSEMIEDTSEAESRLAKSQIFTKPSQSMAEVQTSSVDTVITSPPYLNNFDFAEMTRMYLYFWGIANSWGEITKIVRSKLIVNTTTSIKGHKEIQEDYKNQLPSRVQREACIAVEALKSERFSRKGKKEYDFLVYPYLAQMQMVIQECHRVLKDQGTFHMMVSDAALYGVHLPAPDWLASIMTEAGFKDVNSEKVRDRGHRWVLQKRSGSKVGLGEYYVHGKIEK